MSPSQIRSAPHHLAFDTTRPATMHAVRADTFGDPAVLRRVEVPVPVPGPGELLLRVEAASLNFADTIRRRNGPYPFPTLLPYTPGSEVAGTVVALGEGVTGPAIGTDVFALVGTGAAVGSTGCAQFALAPASQVVPRPATVDAAIASTVFVAGLTAQLMLTRVAQLAAGETVLVHGAAGGVGAYALQLARAAGAGRIIGAVSRRSRMAIAERHGADVAVCTADPTWRETVREQTGGAGVDIVLEMRGGEDLAESLGLLAPFGRLVVYGAASGAARSLSEVALATWLERPAPNQTVHAFNLGLWFALRPQAVAAAMSDVLTQLAHGALSIPVGREFTLDEVAEAHALLESHGSVGKLIVRPWA